MKKTWLPYPIYFLKPFAVGLVGFIILYVSEDLFTYGVALLCCGYSGWIIFMRVVWSVKNAAQSRIERSKEKKDKTYTANFPE